MKILNVPEIMKFHKNRYPWFFVDTISFAAERGVVCGYKSFSCNEHFRHYCSEKIVPAFIVGEVLEQTFLMTFMTENPNVITNTVSSDMSYERQIILGEKLEIHAELESFRRGMARGTASGFIDKELVCKGRFLVALPEIMKKFVPVF